MIKSFDKISTLSRLAPVTYGPDSKAFFFGHRGASYYKIGNTIESFALAGSMGVAGNELDVRLTKDNTLVVHHDPHFALSSSSCVQHTIKDTMRADLPPHIPSLVEALDACDGWVNVEIKNNPKDPDFDPTDNIANHVCDTLMTDETATGRYIISSFRNETLMRVKSICPEVRTALLVKGEELLDPVYIESITERVKLDGHVALHCHEKRITERLVTACHARDLQISAWTVNCAERAAQLLEWHVDGLCGDIPDEGLKWIQEASLDSD